MTENSQVNGFINKMIKDVNQKFNIFILEQTVNIALNVQMFSYIFAEPGKVILL